MPQDLPSRGHSTGNPPPYSAGGSEIVRLYRLAADSPPDLAHPLRTRPARLAWTLTALPLADDDSAPDLGPSLARYTAPDHRTARHAAAARLTNAGYRYVRWLPAPGHPYAWLALTAPAPPVRPKGARGTVLTHVQIAEAARRYRAGASCDALASVYGVSASTIRRRLAAAGVPLRTR